MAPPTTPKDGWVEELYEAVRDAKSSDNTTATQQLRIARAARQLRRWPKCRKAAVKGLSLSPSDREKQELGIHKSLAEKEEQSTAKSEVSDGVYQRNQRPPFATGGMNIDTSIFVGSYENTNLLQAAACQGDVPFLEDIISLGAAIDYPVVIPGDYDPSKLYAPPGATALVLICTNLAVYYGTHVASAPIMGPQLQTVLDGQVECAIRLVKLGADCDSKLTLPSRRSRNLEQTVIEDIYRQYNMVGMTAKELAVLSKRTRIMNAMNEMTESIEAAIEKVQCRCGSRLPWTQCHAGRRQGEAPHYHPRKDNRSELNWRYSPSAPCPCKLAKKDHYRCCWDSSTPWYQDDRNGSIIKIQTQSAHGPGGQAMVQSMMQMIRMRQEESGDDPHALLFPARDSQGNPLDRQYTNEEFRNLQSEVILEGGQSLFDSMTATMIGPKSCMKDWDHEVCAGCLARIENSFMWNDLHWELDKPELLLRVKEWNEALEKYCDDKGLTGSERTAVVAKHTASPFAPCANPACNNVETTVKEYLRCAKCKKVSYCSRACQQSDWKEHKKGCFGSQSRPVPR